MQELSIHVVGLALKGALFQKHSQNVKQPAVLFIHGWESRQDRMFDLAQELSERGYVCLTFDMRGHGASEGDHLLASRRDFLDDAIAAYDTLLSQEGVDSDRVMAIGSSFGAYLTALLSAERRLVGMVLRVPADYRDRGFDLPFDAQRLEWEHSQWKQTPHAANETASLRAVHEFDGDILIVEAEKDEIIPTATVQSYREAAEDKSKVTYEVLHGAPHSISKFPELQQEFSNVVLAWLRTLK